MRLELININKSYGKTKALTDFTAVFEPGIYALLGPNGSGKSTLINIITDNLGRDSGKIIYDGQSTDKMGVKFREKIGFMPQYPGLYPMFTCEELLWYMAKLKGVKTSDATEQITQLLAAVELSDSAKTKVRALSGGMKQRLALAQAMLGNPEIIILDEPTAGLDPKQRISVRNYISSIAMHRIVIIATHVVSDIEFIANDILMLKKGRLAAFDKPDRIIEKSVGKVWTCTIEEEKLPEYEKSVRIVGMAKCDGGVNVRFISDGAMTDNSVPVTPTLEDCYLCEFGAIDNI